MSSLPFPSTLLKASLGMLLGAALAGGAARAQSTNWTGDAEDGIFSDSGNWDNGVPTSSANANISPVGTNTITVGSTSNVLDLTLSSGNTLAVPGTLVVFGGLVSNAGQIAVNDGTLSFTSNVTLSGGGIVNLSANPFVNESGGGVVLTNVDNTFTGEGQLGQNGLSVDNQSAGTIDANLPGGTLSLNGGGAISNEGLLEATNGGILTVSGNVTNSVGANISANGGTVNLGGNVSGGTLNSLNGGVLQADAGTYSGITISPGSTLTDINTIFVQGTLNNLGTIALPNTTFTISGGDVTLQGGGTVQMTNDPFINEASVGLTLRNVDNLIEGEGQLGQNGMALDNQAAGTVNANLSGDVLSLNGAGLVSNEGLLEATNGGILTINDPVTNTGANITANAGTVNIEASVTGGNLNTANGGVMEVIGASPTLANVTLTTGSTLLDESTVLLQGTFNNLGTVTVPNTTVTITGGDLTLQGGGTVTMTSDAFFNASAAGETLHNVDNVIQGSGQLGQNGMVLDNQAGGTIDANISETTLSLNGSGLVTNAGLIEATASGTLQIENNVTNSGAGAITANGGSIALSGNVTGGTLSAINGGTLQAVGTPTLANLALTAGSVLDDTGTLFLQGTFTNSGTVTVPDTTVTLTGGNVVLQGGGTVSLTSNAFFNASTAGEILHNVDNVIEGTGELGQNGMALDNEAGGSVLANLEEGTLSLDGGGAVTNEGLLEATADGTLQITNVLTNTGTVEANEGTVTVVATPTNFAGGTLTGGVWDAANGGTLVIGDTVSTIVTNGPSTTLILDGAGSSLESGSSSLSLEQTLATNNGTLEVLSGRNYASVGTLTNNGTIELGGGTFSGPAINAGPGSALSGSGAFAPTAPIAIAGGAQVSPGTQAAHQYVNTLTFGGGLMFGAGGVYTFDIMNSVSPVAGVDNDTVHVTGPLTISTAGSPFTFAIESINPGTGLPGMANFSSGVASQWTLASATSISGFGGANFSFNTAAFANSLGMGQFSVSSDGTDLFLDFTPVPEPLTWALVMAGLPALGCFLLRHRHVRALVRA